MFEFRSNRVIVELWPSLEELRASKMEDKYTARLTDFYRSVKLLLEEFHSSNVPVKSYTDDHLEKGEVACRAFPPEIVELAAWFASSGIALALYKALRLWVDLKNGRRIKIVDGGLEVEATQMTEKQFVVLLDLIREHREKRATKEDLRKTLENEGFRTRSVDSTDRLEERRALKNAARR